jgi:hypothetical protein
MQGLSVTDDTPTTWCSQRVDRGSFFSKSFAFGEDRAAKCSNQPLKSESGTEFFDAETEGRIPLSSSAETDVETRTNSKSPLFAGQPHGSPAEFDT